MHPASAVRHRWRLARLPAARPRSTSAAPVHGHLLCMSLFLLFRLIPTPRSRHVADDGLSARVNVDVLDGHLLLSLAAMAIDLPAQSSLRADRNTAKPVVNRWFGRADGVPFFFAGIWREWQSDVGAIKAPNVGLHCLSAILTTEPNGVVQPIHDKAMPVMLMDCRGCGRVAERHARGGAEAAEASARRRPRHRAIRREEGGLSARATRERAWR